MCSNPACLRDNWCSVCNCCRRMDEPKSKRAMTGRFSKPISPTSMQRICKGYVPANTGKSTKWAEGVLHHWRDARNATAEEEKCTNDLFTDCNIKTLNYWLSQFVVEVWQEDAKPYPASSISNILAGLYRHAKTIVPDCPNFMNQKDT